MLFKYCFFFLLICQLISCRQNNHCNDPVDVSEIKLEVSIERLEDKLFQFKFKEQIQNFLEKYPDLTRKYLKNNRPIEDSVLVFLIEKMVRDKSLDSVYQDCKMRFGDMESIRLDFEMAFKHIKYYYPEFKAPKIYTLITGLGSFFGSDLYISEDMIVISLDFFYGKGARFRPPVELMPNYIWKRFHPQAIVPACVQYISDRYIKSDLKDKAMLAEMIFYGKSYQFVKTMMPCLNDTLLTGYTQTEMNNVLDKDNKKYIWKHFIDKGLLFNTNHLTKQSYLEERPFVAEINQQCPGRIGRWLGFQIVKKYMERLKGVSLQQVMNQSNAQQILQDSEFKGE